LWFGTSWLNSPAVNHWVAFFILVLFPINWRNCPLYCSIWLQYTSLLPAVQYSFWGSRTTTNSLLDTGKYFFGVE
jgi:hypothetical protein